MRVGPLFACSLLLALAACSRAGRDWKEAERSDTPTAYERFVATHPTSEHAAEAHLRLERFAYQAANQGAGPERRRALESFVERYRSGTFAPRARRTIEELDFEAARASGLLADLEGYLATYPAGRFGAEARDLVERRLADRPVAFRALRRVRLLVEKDFTHVIWNPERAEVPFDPNIDLASAGRVWLARAGLVGVEAGEPAEGILGIKAGGDSITKMYETAGGGGLFGLASGAALTGSIRLEAGPGVAVERKFHGKVAPPERVSLPLGGAGSPRFQGAPFDRAALLPGSFHERLAEVICNALGPSVLAGDAPDSVAAWNGVSEARMRKILAECVGNREMVTVTDFEG